MRGRGTRAARRAMKSMGVEHEMGGPVMEGVLEPIHDLSPVTDRETLVRERWPSDVAAQAFEGIALVGMAHGAAMEPQALARTTARLPLSCGARITRMPDFEIESIACVGFESGGVARPLQPSSFRLEVRRAVDVPLVVSPIEGFEEIREM